MSNGVCDQVFEYNGIGRVLFGVNAQQQAGVEAQKLTEKRNCLIITDSGVARAHLLDGIELSLKQAGFTVSICDEVEPEPTIPGYRRVLEFAESARPDVIVGVGGGSSMDTSKTVARALVNPGPFEQYLGGDFPGPGIPVITMPTTSGTAAEVTPDSVVLLPEEKVKSGFFNTRATVAIVDPTLTLTLPPKLTAGTGIDALAHAIESALSKTATPLTQAVALESIRLISANLRVATYDGSNLEARTNMAWGSLLEGFSEGNAGDVEGHVIGTLLGGYYRIHHGEACGIGLPYCMKYNLPVNVPVLARIAKAMDENISGTPRDMAEKGVYAVHELIRELPLATSISEIKGARKDDLPELAQIYGSSSYFVGVLLFDNFCKRGRPSEREATALFEDMFEPSFSVR